MAQRRFRVLAALAAMSLRKATIFLVTLPALCDETDMKITLSPKMVRMGRELMLVALGIAIGFGLRDTGPQRASAQGREAPALIAAQQVDIVDASNRRIITLGQSAEGSPGIWLFDRNGRARLNLGLYDDGNAAIVLNDDQERAVEIFRTVGPENNPVLVLKSEGKDRLVMGLTGATHDPFFVIYDANGAKKTLFGSY